MKISLTLAFLLWSVLPTFAQSMFPNQRDDSYPLLGLKRAYASFEKAKNDFERNKNLLEKGLISESQFDQFRAQMADAEVNYQQSLLVLLFEQQFVSVRSAVKKQTPNGKKWVSVTLENTTGLSSEYQHLIPTADSLFQQLKPERIHNIYVSLSNDENAIISKPYEQKIAVLESGKPHTLQFEVLQDVDALTVNIVYGNGSSRNPKVYLEKDASVNKVLFQAQQFSQEVELNGSATFGLDLELFSGTENTYKLEVVNLPSALNRYFTERGSNTRISQIRFNQSTKTRQAELRVFLPDRNTETVQTDQTIPFYVVAVPSDRLMEFGDLTQRQWTVEQLQEQNLGFTRLELIPRGTGRLSVKAPQLYLTSEEGKPITLKFSVKNEGTRLLQNVEFNLDLPLGWKAQSNPFYIESLPVREEKEIEIVVNPKLDVTVGRYEIRLKTSSISDNTPITAEDKLFTVEVPATQSFWSTFILLLMLISLLSALVYGAMKLARK